MPAEQTTHQIVTGDLDVFYPNVFHGIAPAVVIGSQATDIGCFDIGASSRHTAVLNCDVCFVARIEIGKQTTCVVFRCNREAFDGRILQLPYLMGQTAYIILTGDDYIPHGNVAGRRGNH